MDILKQAIDVVKQYWPKDDEEDRLEIAVAQAISAQPDTDWLVASAFSYKSIDTPKAYIIILWRSIGAAETVAKVQIKPVLLHWNVPEKSFVIVNLTRLE